MATAEQPKITIGVKSDTRHFQATCRAIAKHMTALADELAALEDQPLIALEPVTTPPAADGQTSDQSR